MSDWILTIMCWCGIFLSIASFMWFAVNVGVVTVKALREDNDND